MARSCAPFKRPKLLRAVPQRQGYGQTVGANGNIPAANSGSVRPRESATDHRAAERRNHQGHRQTVANVERKRLALCVRQSGLRGN